MSTPVGNELGYIEIVQNDQIPHKDPTTDFGANNINNENLLYDSVKGWDVVDGGSGRLPEGNAFTYGANIKVQANWRKKVRTIIFCTDPDFRDIAEQELYPYMSIVGGAGGDEHVTQFFNNNEDATFSVALDNIANKTITTSGGNTYRFLGWATAYVSDRVEWDSMETPWTLYHPINFLPSPQYIKNELAMFLYGNEIRLCVKTNLQEINVGNEKFKYSLNISGHNPEIRFFNNYPEEQGAYPWKSFDSQDFGRSFNCRVCDDSLICGSYEFRGWVRGDYASTTPPSEFWTTNQETPTIDAIISPIIFTAVYLRSDNVYTITYYSGLD